MKHRSPKQAIRRLGRRQVLRGAIILGSALGIMMGTQGPAYQAAYPTAESRHAFIATLDAAPALGAMAGETVNATTPASYSIYKSIVVATLATAVWGLVVTARLLRGQEESGQLEIVQVGSVSRQQVTVQLLLGMLQSLLLSMTIAWVFIALLGQLPHVNLDTYHAALLTLAMYLPGVVFASLGALISQLTITCGRAILIGMSILTGSMVLRAFANTSHDLNWLKHLSPFGWSDLLNPVLGPHLAWIIIPTVIAAIIFGLSCLLSSQRDFAAGLLPQKTSSRSHFWLLRSPLYLSLRLQTWSFICWTAGIIGFAALMASLATLSVSILESSDGAQQIITKLGDQSDNLAVAFIGFGTIFTSLLLFVMSVTLLSRIRQDESNGHIDHLLTQPISRRIWLAGRIALLISLSALIAELSMFITWAIAHGQGINELTIANLAGHGIQTVALVSIVIGLGSFFYGVLPRLTLLAPSFVIVWSYTVDTLGSLLNLPHWIINSSLLHYMPASLTGHPNWSATWWFGLSGLCLISAGIEAFARRDITNN